MELKRYNDIQRDIFKKYNIIENIMLKDIIEFNKICSLLSIIKIEGYDIINPLDLAEFIVTRELKLYNK